MIEISGALGFRAYCALVWPFFRISKTFNNIPWLLTISSTSTQDCTSQYQGCKIQCPSYTQNDQWLYMINCVAKCRLRHPLRGAQRRALLCDLGICKDFDSPMSESAIPIIPGTTSFMSWELFDDPDKRKGDGAYYGDIWALGCTILQVGIFFDCFLPSHVLLTAITKGTHPQAVPLGYYEYRSHFLSFTKQETPP